VEHGSEKTVSIILPASGSEASVLTMK